MKVAPKSVLFSPAYYTMGYEKIDKSTVLRMIGEKVARKMGIERPEVEVDFVENGDFRISVMEDGEVKGVLWVNAETGKVWGFSLSHDTPRERVSEQMREFVEVLKRVI